MSKTQLNAQANGASQITNSLSAVAMRIGNAAWVIHPVMRLETA
jgi:hypothetical protein